MLLSTLIMMFFPLEHSLGFAWVFLPCSPSHRALVSPSQALVCFGFPEEHGGAQLPFPDAAENRWPPSGSLGIFRDETRAGWSQIGCVGHTRHQEPPNPLALAQRCSGGNTGEPLLQRIFTGCRW